MTIHKNLDVSQQGMPDNPQECVGEITSFKGNGTRIASSTNRATGAKPLSQQGVLQERSGHHQLIVCEVLKIVRDCLD